VVHSATGWLNDGYSVGSADSEAEADASSEADASLDADGSAELDGSRLELGFGGPDGSGNKELGNPRKASTNIRTKMATTARTQGRAMVSLRVGKAPR
jgi:hypothetical protein